MLPSGFKPYLVHNLKDLEPLFTQNTVYAAVISHQVGGSLRKKLEQVAKERNITVVNAGVRVKKEEQE
jgi:ribosomal protein L32E